MTFWFCLRLQKIRNATSPELIAWLQSSGSLLPTLTTSARFSHRPTASPSPCIIATLAQTSPHCPLRVLRSISTRPNDFLHPTIFPINNRYKSFSIWFFLTGLGYAEGKNKIEYLSEQTMDLHEIHVARFESSHVQTHGALSPPPRARDDWRRQSETKTTCLMTRWGEPHVDGNTKQFRAQIQAISEGVDTRVENHVQDRCEMLRISKLHIFWHFSMHLFYSATRAGGVDEMDDLEWLIWQCVGCCKQLQRQNQL